MVLSLHMIISDIISSIIIGLDYSKYIGEGNGNPLQSSCLENPMDGEVW